MNRYAQTISWRRWAAGVAFLGPLLLFAATTSLYPVPGASAGSLAHHAGLMPMAGLQSPLWGMAVRGAAAIPVGPLAARINLLTAFLMAGAVRLFFGLLASVKLDPDYEACAPGVRLLGALAASFYLAVLLPVWLLANRAHPAAFDLFYFLAALSVLRRYLQQGGRRLLPLLGLLFGLGAFESGLFIAAGPVLGLLFLYHAFLKGDFKPLPLLAGAAGFAVGLAAAILPAWLFTSSRPWLLEESNPLLRAVWMIWITPIKTLWQTIPQVGWLIIVMVSALPFLAALWARRDSPIDNRPGSLLFVQILLLGLTGALLFNIPIAPWTLPWLDRTFILPSLMIAAAFGLSVMFWTVLLRHALSRRKARRSEPWMLGFVLALVVSAAAVNGRQIDTGGGRTPYRAAAYALEPLPDGAVLITAGWLDPWLACAAHDRGQSLRLVSLGQARDPLYIRYLRSILETDRLRSLAGISLDAMLHEWIGAHSNRLDRLAFQEHPEALVRAGMAPVARNGLYLGARGMDGIDADHLLTSSEPYRRFCRESLVSSNPIPRTAAGWMAERLSRHAARNLNDLGYLLSLLDQRDEALALFDEAVRIHPEALSPRLNQILVRSAEERPVAPGALDALRERVRRAAEEGGLGSAIERSGLLPARQAADLLNALLPQRASPAPTAADEERREALNRDVQTLLQEVRSNEAERAFRRAREFVERWPDLDAGWVLLGMMSHARQDRETYQIVVERMREADRMWPPIMQIEADRHLAAGDREEAANLYAMLHRMEPGHVAFLERLCQLEFEHGVSPAGLRLLERLLARDPDNYWGNFLLGGWHVQKGEYALAESAFRQALAVRWSPPVLNNIAWVLHRQGDREEARRLAREAVARAPGMAAGWDTLGGIHEAEGELDEAEKAYRKAHALAPRDPEIAARFASALIRTGREQEGAKLVRSLLEGEPDLSKDERDRLEALLPR
jgi:tetratricopeptide (TPR) repeat protein